MTAALIIGGLLVALVLLGGLRERRRLRWREQHEARLLAMAERRAQADSHPHTGEVVHFGTFHRP